MDHDRCSSALGAATRLGILLVTVLSAGCADGGPDLVVLGGSIWTGDPGQPWAEALSVAGGVIDRVGSTAAIQATSTITRRVRG